MTAAESLPSAILDAIGNTPLVHLQNLRACKELALFAKAEYLNAGGSVKSRTALAMIRDAKASGALRSGDTIVEVSSGNEGVALAMLGAIYGHPVTIIMPNDIPCERKVLIERYGGRVILVPAQANVAHTLDACFAIAEELASQTNFYYARQFENPANVRVHEETTGPEIALQIGGEIAAFVAGVGTGGTLTGVGRALKRRYPRVHVVAVEPATAAVLSGGSVSTHRQYGIGEGFVPALLDRTIVDEVITVSDDDAYRTAEELASEEGLMVGPTSGSNVYAALEVGRKRGFRGPIVTVLPDSAERYLSMHAEAPSAGTP